MRSLDNRLKNLEAIYRQRVLPPTAVENPMDAIPLTFAGRMEAVAELFDIARQREAAGEEPYPSTPADEQLEQRCLESLEIAHARLAMDSRESGNER